MEKYKRPRNSKRKAVAVVLLLISLIFVMIATALAVVGCSFIGNRRFTETFYNTSSMKVNNKIRVIQISDLHNCTFGVENRSIIRRVEKLKPDLIIYTGDCIESSDESVANILHLCGELSKIAPSYYIYGNNEVEKYYDVLLNQEDLDKKFGFNDKNRDPKKLLENKDDLEKQLEGLGVKVLKNKKDTITIGKTKVDVYGVLTSNPSSFWSYGGESFEEYIYSNENNLKITAIHEPLVFKEFTPDSWGDLMVAGHTHGGMTKIPFLGPAYTYEGGILPERNGDYVYGRYEVQGSPLIVSSGLENETFLRINNQPEIVIIDINKF